MNNFKIAIYWLLGIIVLLLVIFGLNYAGYLGDKFFLPRQEAIRHATFDCSQEHGDSVVRELRQYQDQYTKQDAAGRKIIADRYAQEYNSYNCDAYPLPSDIVQFREIIR